jgi:hypothetical protein
VSTYLGWSDRSGGGWSLSGCSRRAEKLLPLLLLLLRSLALLRRLLLLDKVVLLLLLLLLLLRRAVELLLEVVGLLESGLLERGLRLPEAVLLVEVAEVLHRRLERLLRLLERRLLRRRRLEAVVLLRLLRLLLLPRELLLVVAASRRVVGRKGRLERAQQLFRGSEEVGHLLRALLRLRGERVVAKTRRHSEVSILQHKKGMLRDTSLLRIFTLMQI